MAQHVITSHGIAYVPENRRLFPRLSVRDNLRLGSYLYRGEADREAPLDLVFQLFPRLQERLEQRAETLSGGEQQMLAIGRALMTRPRLLMLDEPSQGIMPKLVDEIFQAVKRIRDAGMTVLIVEQRMSECLEIADRAYILQTGRVLMQGSAADIRVKSRCAQGLPRNVTPAKASCFATSVRAPRSNAARTVEALSDDLDLRREVRRAAYAVGRVVASENPYLIVGFERLASLVAPSGLSQEKPCARICMGQSPAPAASARTLWSDPLPAPATDSSG